MTFTNCELTENIRKLVEEALFAAVLTAVNLVADRVADEMEDGIEYRDPDGGGPCVAGPVADRARAGRIAKAHEVANHGQLYLAARLFADLGMEADVARCLDAIWGPFPSHITFQ